LAIKIYVELLKSKMAQGRHLEKYKNHHISAMVGPTGIKFRVLVHIGPLSNKSLKFSTFKNPILRTAAILKNLKSSYVGNDFAD